MLLPFEPSDHATMRNCTHRVAAELEGRALVTPKADIEPNTDAELIVLIDGTHIRTAPGYQTRNIDVTVGKIEMPGRTPLVGVTQASKDQAWQPGKSVMVLSDGEAALPASIRAAIGEPVTCIMDWWHISVQTLRGI